MAFAQDQSTHAVVLDEVTVTSTKTERALADVPVHTRVIDAAQIQSMHATSLSEVLAHVPGIQVRELHGKTGSGVWIQGLDANRVLVIVDGVPLTPSIGSSIDISQIAVSDIQQIEIIKGAMASLYGTSAMGGVVNIITQKPRHKLESRVAVTTGNWQEQSQDHNPFAKRSIEASAATLHDRWYAQMAATINESKGYTVDNTPATQGWYGYKNNVAGKLGYTFANNLQISSHHRLYSEDVATVKQDPIPGFGYRYPIYTDITTKTHNTLSLKRSGQSLDWQLRLSHEDARTQSSKASQRKSTTQHSSVAADASSQVGDDHLLAYGFQLSKEYLDATNLTTNKHEVKQAAKNTSELYFQYSYFASDNFEIMPGLRLDKNERNGEYYAPSINTLYSAGSVWGGNTKLRFGIGRGYRSPHLKELFYVFDHSQVGYMVLGNTKLKPEESVSTQASLEWVVSTSKGRQHGVEIGVYHNDITNLIETDLSHRRNQVAIYSYQNLRSATTKGLDLGYVYSTPTLAWDIYYSYLQAKDNRTHTFLPKRPENTLKTQIEYHTSADSSVLVSHRFEGASYIDTQNTIKSKAFSVTDVRANYAFTHSWKIYGGVNNIGNVQRDFTGVDIRPAEGRFVYLGIEWNGVSY